MLFFDDLIGTVADLFFDGIIGALFAKMSSQLAEIAQCDTGHISTAESCNLAVSMLADDKCMHAPAVHIQMLSQTVF